jgi:glucose dehydrogenase
VTGNGVPQLGGEDRAGDNLYLCSVVALDMKTGTLKWHYQVIRHDVWEADIAISPPAPTSDGRTVRRAVPRCEPTGAFLLDRETGKPLTKVEDRRVPQDAAEDRGDTAARWAPTARCGLREWRRRGSERLRVGCFHAGVGAKHALAEYGVLAGCWSANRASTRPARRG